MPVPKTPLLAANCVLVDAKSRVLMVRRRFPPFEGQLALPGGFVDIGETVENACRREMMEETGVKVGRLHLVGIYSEPTRDPRGHSCAVAFWARARSAKAVAGDDAAAVEWVADWRRKDLAFDHGKIIADAMRLMQAKKDREDG